MKLYGWYDNIFKYEGQVNGRKAGAEPQVENSKG